MAKPSSRGLGTSTTTSTGCRSGAVGEDLARGGRGHVDIQREDADSRRLKGAYRCDDDRVRRLGRLEGEGVPRIVKPWLDHRGADFSPMFFCPVSLSGKVRRTSLRGESIAYNLRRRQQQAGTAPFSPHDLIRTAVTHLLDAGVDVLTVQKLAGHADASMTTRYDHRDEGAKRRAAQVRVLAIPG